MAVGDDRGLVAWSVAMATHDGEAHLVEQLDGVLDQTLPPDELVVYDDASTDGTVGVLVAFAREASFPVRILRGVDRRGAVRAFEQALGACRGARIALCDQDDRWLPEKLAVLDAALSGHDTVLAFSDAHRIDEEGRPLAGTLWSELAFRRREQGSLAASPPGPLLRHAVASGCTMAFDARILAAALPFPAVLELVAHPMLHDRWLSLVAGCAGRVVPLPEPLVEYRRHPGQAVGARRVGPASDLPAQASRRAADVRARAEARLRQLDELEARLGRLPDEPTPGVLAQLADLRRHLGVRASLPDRRGRRLPSVVGEAVSGGYRRFGGGHAGAVLDALRR